MKKSIHVGIGLEEAARRFAETWHRAERGEAVEAEDNVTLITESVPRSLTNATDRKGTKGPIPSKRTSASKPRGK